MVCSCYLACTTAPPAALHLAGRQACNWLRVVTFQSNIIYHRYYCRERRTMIRRIGPRRGRTMDSGRPADHTRHWSDWGSSPRCLSLCNACCIVQFNWHLDELHPARTTAAMQRNAMRKSLQEKFLASIVSGLSKTTGRICKHVPGPSIVQHQAIF